MYSQFIDYALFFAFLIGSTLYPLWGGLRRNKKDTKANYVFASGQVSVFAMMLSIARGTLGVRAFLGKWKYALIFLNLNFIEILSHHCDTFIFVLNGMLNNVALINSLTISYKILFHFIESFGGGQVRILPRSLKIR